MRLFCTHDCVDHIPVFDVLAATRVGEGVLVMSAIDHEDPPGRWMLQRIIEWLGGDVEIDAEVRPDVLRAIRV